MTLSELSYSFDVSFSIPLGKAAPAPRAVQVEVSGDTSDRDRALASRRRCRLASGLDRIGDRALHHADEEFSMSEVMAACGVLCSGCPAYHAKQKGAAHQRRTAAAWRRIYRLKETPGAIACGGCQAPEDQLFHTCRRCAARRCCLSRGFASCAECATRPCAKLEKAQSGWDSVPALADRLSAEDFETYARPYCGHRQRLEAARQGR